MSNENSETIKRQSDLIYRCLDFMKGLQRICSDGFTPGPRFESLMQDLLAAVDPEALPPDDVRLLAMANQMMHEKLSLQSRIGDWQGHTFGEAQTVSALLVKLGDELRELLLADKTEDVIDESADMLHCLFGLAELMKFDLLDATERKFAVNRSSKWGNPDERGVISHVDKVE